MATVVFTAIGAAVGGPVGAAVGAVIGSQVDAELFRGADRQGPRVKDLTITSSAYGAIIPRHFGQMRVGGSIIWATDLVEHSSTSSTGKGKPNLTSYTYTTSFAVALASRPILGVGRVWADGQLLRGASGDLKVGGSIRIYTGSGDQSPDPLIASSEGLAACPAFRNVAYVVFEDLQLASYGNRIPSLNFEIFCDEGALSLNSAMEGLVENVEANVSLDGILGFSCEGPLTSLLAQFDTILPMTSDANGTSLTVSRSRLQAEPIPIGEAAVSDANGDFGGQVGFIHKLASATSDAPRIMRYYDIDADYQPCSQRAPGREIMGQPKTIDLPATLNSVAAYQIIANVARNSGWSRETMAWRCATLDNDIGPGSLITIDGNLALWRVNEWEWRSTGVDLTLERVAPECDVVFANASPGQSNLAVDNAITPTLIAAFEAPMADTNSVSEIYAALSSESSGWNGAALFIDNGDGQLISASPSGRARSIIGKSLSVLLDAETTIFDRASQLDIHLASADMILTDCSPRELAMGANKALVGSEVIQFATATPLGAGKWRLSNLLRGRAGTEGAVAGHTIGENFIILNDTPVIIDYTKVSDSPLARITAIGIKDTSLAEAAIACRGVSTRPLAPVHTKIMDNGDGTTTLTWERRSRGAWRWPDVVDVPLQEEVELYQIGIGNVANPVKIWPAYTTSLIIPTHEIGENIIWVRQIGTYSMSDAANFKKS